MSGEERFQEDQHQDVEVGLASGMADVGRVQPEKDHFPMCIVWMPLPVLTWLIPFVGHVGITTSQGTIHDFAGSHYINVRPSFSSFLFVSLGI